VTAIALKKRNCASPRARIGLATGAVCGFVNGALAVLLRIPMIIVTLGTLSVYHGLALMVSNASPISRFGRTVSSLLTLGGGKILGVPTSVVAMLIVGALGWLALTRSIYGRRIEAMGSAPITARLAGIPLDRYRVAVMTLNGVIAALAGIIALAFLQSADPNMGSGFELWVIASVIIGGTALSGGHGSAPGAILGALIIAVIRNGLVLLGASTYAGTAVTGAVIILAVAIDFPSSSASPRRASESGGPGYPPQFTENFMRRFLPALPALAAFAALALTACNNAVPPRAPTMPSTVPTAPTAVTPTDTGHRN